MGYRLFEAAALGLRERRSVLWPSRLRCDGRLRDLIDRV